MWWGRQYGGCHAYALSSLVGNLLACHLEESRRDLGKWWWVALAMPITDIAIIAQYTCHVSFSFGHHPGQLSYESLNKNATNLWIHISVEVDSVIHNKQQCIGLGPAFAKSSTWLPYVWGKCWEYQHLVLHLYDTKQNEKHPCININPSLQFCVAFVWMSQGLSSLKRHLLDVVLCGM